MQSIMGSLHVRHKVLARSNTPTGNAPSCLGLAGHQPKGLLHPLGLSCLAGPADAPPEAWLRVLMAAGRHAAQGPPLQQDPQIHLQQPPPWSDFAALQQRADALGGAALGGQRLSKAGLCQPTHQPALAVALRSGCLLGRASHEAAFVLLDVLHQACCSMTSRSVGVQEESFDSLACTGS